MTPWLLAAGCVVAGYLLGDLPVGLAVGHFSRSGDIRDTGSGKTGTTNVLRRLGPRAAITVLFWDTLKGALATGLVRLLWVPLGPLAPWVLGLTALAAIAGHIWPVFLGFRGGRGVATSGGALWMLQFQVPVIMLVSGLAVVGLTRYVSLGSLIGVATYPVSIWLLTHSPLYTAFGLAAAALVWVAHSDNIKRLLSGQERRLGRSKPGAKAGEG